MGVSTLTRRPWQFFLMYNLRKFDSNLGFSQEGAKVG